MRRKNKGFTLIELLAVIVILGLLMAIAIPSVTKYITESRKKTVVSTIGNYITAMVNEVNDLTYTFTEENTIYAVPIECIALERGGTNPFGAWHQANDVYWAYVLVQYDDETSSYRYGYTFKDSAGYGLYPTAQSKLNEGGKQIKTGLSLTKPVNGKITNITAVDNWNGFGVNNSTNLIVLEAETEGNIGDGINTCTLQQKGDNYEQVEEDKKEDLPEDQLPMIRYTSGFDDDDEIWKYNNSIVSITFEDTINIPSDAYESWDVSSTGNGKVMAYIKTSSSNSRLYDLYIQGDGKIYANYDSSKLFYQFFNVQNIYNLELLDTSKVVNMTRMFAHMSRLNSLDLSSFDTSNVTDMNGMFLYTGESNAAFTLNLGKSFDTSKVTDMSNMFEYTGRNSNAFTLDLGDKFNTGKVTNMNRMFWFTGENCPVFTLNIGNNFDTSNVNDMGEMFRGTGYKSTVFTLDLGDKFNTSKVTNMNSMFNQTGYKSTVFTLDLGEKFDTSNVTDMSSVFAGAGFSSKVFTLDLGDKFDTSNVTVMGFMFQQTGYNSTIFKLNLGEKFYTSKVTNMAMMFWYTGNANSSFKLDCSNWSVENTTTYYNFTNDETRVVPPKWVK